MRCLKTTAKNPKYQQKIGKVTKNKKSICDKLFILMLLTQIMVDMHMYAQTQRIAAQARATNPSSPSTIAIYWGTRLSTMRTQTQRTAAQTCVTNASRTTATKHVRNHARSCACWN